MNRRLIAWAGTTIIAGGTGIIALCAQAQDRPQTAGQKSDGTPRILIRTLTPELWKKPESIRLTGQIEAYRIAAVAAEVSEQVLSRPVRRGDRVEVGQTIALLNNDLTLAALHQAEAAAQQTTAARKQAEAEYARAVVETRASVAQANAQLQTAEAGEQKARTATRTQELAQAEATLNAAKAEETLASKDYDRYEQLVKEETLPRQALDRAKMALDAAVAKRGSAEQAVSLAKEGARREDIAQAVAQVAVARAGVEVTSARPQRLEAIRRQIESLRAQEKEAQAGVEQAKIAIQKRQITAPFAGRVLETLIEKGEMTTPGHAILRIADVRAVKAIFALPEALRGAVKLGQSVTLSADGLHDASFSGRVSIIGFEADNRARTFPVEIAINNPQEQLLPGMVVRIALSSSVGANGSKNIIPVSAIASDGLQSYVFRVIDNRVKRQDVTTGMPVGTDRVEIVSGLKPGEVIAVAPQRLTDGAQIETAIENKKEAAR